MPRIPTDGFRLVSLVDNNVVVFGGGADNGNDNIVVVQEILYAGQRRCNSVVFFEIVDSSSNPPPPPPLPFDVASSPARRKNDSCRGDTQTCDTDNIMRRGTFE